MLYMQETSGKNFCRNVTEHRDIQLDFSSRTDVAMSVPEFDIFMFLFAILERYEPIDGQMGRIGHVDCLLTNFTHSNCTQMDVGVEFHARSLHTTNQTSQKILVVWMKKTIV